MKKFIFSAIAIMVVSLASAQDLKSVFEAGATAFKTKDYAKAASLLEQVINKGMDDATATTLVATAKQYLPKSYYMLGGSALKSGNYPSARENFGKAAEYAELYDDMATMVKSNQWIGKTYEIEGGKLFNQKNFAAALPTFESGYASDPRNAKMANWLGICYCETGNFEKGMDVFEKIVQLGSNPRYAEEASNASNNIVIYTNNQVAKLQESKNYKGVIDLANKMLAANPNSAIAAKVRLQAYMDNGDYANVFDLAESTAKLQTTAEEKSNVYFIQGAAYNAKEMKPQAIAAFQKVTAGPSVAAAKAAIADLSK